jgi:hypothetical protein
MQDHIKFNTLIEKILKKMLLFIKEKKIDKDTLLSNLNELSHKEFLIRSLSKHLSNFFLENVLGINENFDYYFSAHFHEVLIIIYLLVFYTNFQ